MRLATFTIFSFLALGPVNAVVKPTLWDIPQVDNGLFNIGIAHAIRQNCSFIEADSLAGIFYVWKLIGYAKKAGYSLKETRVFIDDDNEKSVLRSRVKKYLKSLGLNSEKLNTLCDFGKVEITNRSQIGKLLRIN